MLRFMLQASNRDKSHLWAPAIHLFYRQRIKLFSTNVDAAQHGNVAVGKRSPNKMRIDGIRRRHMIEAPSQGAGNPDPSLALRALNRSELQLAARNYPDEGGRFLTGAGRLPETM